MHHIPLLALALLAAPAAPPAAPAPQVDDADAYCTAVTSAAASEADRLQAPDLFGSFGMVHSTSQVWSEGEVDEIHPRLSAGLAYSFGSLSRGVAVRDVARADCERYRTLAGLRAFAERGRGELARDALAERARVLAEAMPEAERILAQARARFAQGGGTAAELHATELRVDALRAQLGAARQELAALPAQPTPLPRVGALLAARKPNEERYAREEAALRRARSWDLEVRGGYDQVFGLDHDRVPLFGLVTVTLNLGLLWQGSNDARAVDAWRAWAGEEPEGPDQRVRDALRALQASLATDRARLEEVRTLAADVQQRLSAVSSIGGDRAAEYRSYVWFDAVRTRAEQAYLEAHVRTLARALEELP